MSRGTSHWNRAQPPMSRRYRGEGRPGTRVPRGSQDRRHPGAHAPGSARRHREDRWRRRLPHRPAHHQRRLGRGDEPGAPLRDRPRERGLDRRHRRRRHQRGGRRHGDPAPATVLRPVPGLPRGPGNAVRERLLPGPLEQRRRHGRVPAHDRPRVHQARPEHQPRRRRRAGRRGHHRLPRRAQGRPALYPGTTAVVQGAGGLGHIAIQALAAITGTRMSSSTATPTPSRWPSRSAPTRPSSPTATTSTPSRT